MVSMYTLSYHLFQLQNSICVFNSVRSLIFVGYRKRLENETPNHKQQTTMFN